MSRIHPGVRRLSLNLERNLGRSLGRSFGRITLGSLGILFLLLALLVASEVRNGTLQSQFFSEQAAALSFTEAPGAAKQPLPAPQGPYDQRLGYTDLPQRLTALEKAGYVVQQQAVPSEPMRRHQESGLFPLYDEKATAGLTILDRDGKTLFADRTPSRVFKSYEEIPPLVRESLLFIENRELAILTPPTRNPAIEWDRLASAAFGQILEKLGLPTTEGGGSTLATQAEKFRHSPGGRTGSVDEKLRQMLTASLRAYQYGPDTRKARQRIVLDYLNSMPLTARAGVGEVNGLGDGLHAFFGSDLDTVRRLLTERPADPQTAEARAIAYKQTLALLLALRRPTAYLLQDRTALDHLCNATLDNLAANGVIPGELRDAAQKARLNFLDAAPELPPAAFLEQKAVNAIRTRLLPLLDVASLYALDRLDASVKTTFDLETQRAVTATLRNLADPAFVAEKGLTGFRLLSPSADPAKIVYSVLLYERTAGGNQLRVQADSLDQPLDINDGAKLDLGSTAKLRTLASYLEIIAEIRARYAGLGAEDLVPLRNRVPDDLSRWVIDRLLEWPQPDLPELLTAALNRRYSANPNESFFTGGGIHRFSNFDAAEDGQTPTLTEALAQSINLPFVRLLRDLVAYEIGQGPSDGHAILENPEDPARQDLLEKYADQEGRRFLTRFYADYRDLKVEAALEKLTKQARATPVALAAIVRTVVPEAGEDRYRQLYRTLYPAATTTDAQLTAAFARAGAASSLSDRAYLAGLHPLELWLVAARKKMPEAKLADLIAASAIERQASASWLFETRHKGAQDTRIRIMLEEEAFGRIHARWARLGYPFDRLVPSLATAVGASADRPGALAELMGIILNDGVRRAAVRVTDVTLASHTPYAAHLALPGQAEDSLLDPAIAAVLRTALREVVQNGTARRVEGVYKTASGDPLAVGGKTGTGDHRFDVTAADGTVISSRVVNRTATFAFYLGDRFFGSITAYVAGPAAADYGFTSALPAQLLRILEPALKPMLDRPREKPLNPPRRERTVDPPQLAESTGNLPG